MASANIVFEVGSHSHPVEVVRGVFEAFLGSHVCQLFQSNTKDFAPDIVSFMGCFIGNIWAVSTIILPSFKTKSMDENPTRVVGVLADNVKEWICGCNFSEGMVPFAFEVLSELKVTNIKGSTGFVTEGVIIIGRGIRDRKVFIRRYMV